MVSPLTLAHSKGLAFVQTEVLAAANLKKQRVLLLPSLRQHHHVGKGRDVPPLSVHLVQPEGHPVLIVVGCSVDALLQSPEPPVRHGNKELR